MLTPTTARRMALQILREGGIPSLYRGLTATALRDCGYGAYFAVYETTCRYFSRPTGPSESSTILSQVETEMTRLSWAALLLAGGLAGVAGWVATFPFDVVKTRVQGSQPIPVISTTALALPSGIAQPLLAREVFVNDINPYRTTISAIIHSYRNEGMGVFFRGLSPTLIRAFPVNMVTFATFEAVVHFLS